MNNYKIKFIFLSFLIMLFVGMFFYQPQAMSAGMRNGLYLCTATIIPSMFPFLVVSDFLIRSGMCSYFGRISAKIINFIFRLPGCSACVIFMSLIGGFPVGAKMTAQLIEEKEISNEQGKRLLLFCVNGGPAFTIGVVGVSMLKSEKAGIIIYISLVLSSLLVGFVSRFFAKENDNVKIKSEPFFEVSVFVKSVNQSARAVINICAWVLVFSFINGYLIYLPISSDIVNVINIFAEVTNGCSGAAGNFPTCVLAFAIGWAGLSVHCQVYEYVRKTGLSMWKFQLARLANGLLAMGICYVILYFFPCPTDVFASEEGLVVQPFSGSVQASAAMLILAVFLILDLRKQSYRE